MSNQIRVLVLVIYASTLLTGCGDSLATVHGLVTLDGQPLRKGPELQGTVLFIPENGGPTARAYLDAEGEYRLSSGSQRGTQIGRYRVAVTATKIVPADTPGGAASGRPVTPRHYADPTTSGLTADVQPGDNALDFALISNGKSQ